MGLMRTQRNGLFQRIVERGLQPLEITLADDDDGTTVIRHLPTGSTFALASHDGVAYVGETRIGAYGPYEYGPVYWGDVLDDIFPQWSHNVRLENETLDLWEELRRAREILAGSQRESYDNTLFTSDELQQISAQFRQIKEFLRKAYSLSDEKLVRIEARLDEAEEASRRIGRKDWRLLFCGLILTLIVGDLVTPSVVHHLIVMAFDGLSNLFGGNALPQLPPQA